MLAEDARPHVEGEQKALLSPGAVRAERRRREEEVGVAWRASQSPSYGAAALLGPERASHRTVRHAS